MAADPSYDVLVADLRSLGRAVSGPEPGPGLPAAVLARLGDAPVPAGPGAVGALARRVVPPVRARGRVVAVLVAVVLAAVATPPVRATVADWFGFGGVQVRQGPTPGPTSAPPPPTVGTGGDLRGAAALVTFDVLAPAELGTPDGVSVSADRRVLSMSWSGTADGDLRLDQFDGRLDYTVVKTTPGARFTSLGDEEAVWFDAPHDVVILAPDGTRRAETARLAGRTLLWERGGTTLRLEGELGLGRALEIARSASAVG
jgi:hypothetical protein